MTKPIQRRTKKTALPRSLKRVVMRRVEFFWCKFNGHAWAIINDRVRCAKCGTLDHWGTFESQVNRALRLLDLSPLDKGVPSKVVGHEKPHNEKLSV